MQLDTAVLQFQNQKLVQKLEAQKVEYSTLENKFIQLKEKQKPYDSILKVVNKSMEALITDLESSSTLTRKSSGHDVGCTPNAKGELESAVVELQESNCKLAALKAERDATNGAFFPVLKLGSKHGSGDKVKDKHRNLHEMESSLKELLEQASCRLTELQSLHEERIKILQQLSNLQLVLEGLRAKQLQNTLLLEKHTMEKEIQQASASLDFYNMKAARIEDQLRFCLDQVQKLGEERFQKSVSLENTQKRLSDIRRSSHQAKESLEDS
ncbi:REDUCED DORMANCY 4, histone mono-ubiquitination 1 [Hibiscus trionum]|nr:REDUCED DORMANCY 4, histone mono-ubiquitination 1 [Hibiscus trionum]